MSNKKKEFFLVRWFKRCFLGDRPELSDEEEERIQTPVRAMVANFVHRPLAMIGLIVFLAIFVFVMVGPHIWVLDLSEQDSTLTNLPPSHNMMEVPKALLANGVKDIGDVIQSNSAASEETSATSEELSAEADSLDGLITKFKLREE